MELERNGIMGLNKRHTYFVNFNNKVTKTCNVVRADFITYTDNLVIFHTDSGIEFICTVSSIVSVERTINGTD